MGDRLFYVDISYFDEGIEYLDWSVESQMSDLFYLYHNELGSKESEFQLTVF